jgi:hypothetical protein
MGETRQGAPENTRTPCQYEGACWGEATAHLRNPKRAEALEGNAFSVVWVQCIQTTCGENAVKCRIME